ncbi:hypothetical protein EVAR_70508_1 [Eumeta japonica]|uniref:Uncharacterized protein n=1 Tax=Eumeta variegata TaxID=151549 RepID=A0A4C1SND3_EUMVA|nr:hypothetical protein EVAR_70508_1 [Eumeta japonica]
MIIPSCRPGYGQASEGPRSIVRLAGQRRVAVNVTKTAALLTGQQRTMPPKLRLRRQDVEWQTRVRYLGVQIDRSMRMAAQVEYVIHQSRAVRSMLHPVL